MSARSKDTTPPVDVEAWWAATAKVTQERDRALAEVERLNRAITRVLVLIAPETQTAQPIYGVRSFWASDIRKALEGKP